MRSRDKTLELLFDFLQFMLWVSVIGLGVVGYEAWKNTHG